MAEKQEGFTAVNTDDYALGKPPKAQSVGLSRKKTKDLIFCILLIALPVLQYCVFYIYVNLNSLLLSFKEYQVTEMGYVYAWKKANVFSNFKTAIDNIFSTALGPAVKNSLTLFVFIVFFQTPFALIFSYYIIKKYPGSAVFRVILFLPTVIASVVLSTMFSLIADNIIPELVNILYGRPEDFDVTKYQLLANVDTRFGALLGFSMFTGFGVNVLMYSGSMSGVSADLFEAARLDGVGDFGEFIYVILPSIWNTLVTFLTTSVAAIFTNQMHIFDLYGENASPAIYTLGYYLYSNTVAGNEKFALYPYLSALGLLFTVVAAPLALGVKCLLEKFGPSDE